jgi:hypothetical protein
MRKENWVGKGIAKLSISTNLVDNVERKKGVRTAL